MKRSRKIIKKLNARQKAYEDVNSKEHLRGQGLLMHKPGSQNGRK